MWIKFGVEDKMISWMCDARKSAQWKPGLNLLAYRDFCPSLAHLLYDFGRNVTKQVRSRSYWAFVSFMKMYAENTFTFRMSVYDITLRAYRDTAWNLKVKNALAKSVFCVTRYTIAVFTVFETACHKCRLTLAHVLIRKVAAALVPKPIVNKVSVNPSQLKSN